MIGIDLKYLLLACGGSLGIYQMAAAFGGFRGLWLLRNKVLTFVCGASLLSGTLVWFFSTTDLNSPHPELEGAQQLGYFLLGALLALLVTFALSSMINFNLINPRDSDTSAHGLDELKQGTIFQAIAHRLRNRKGNS